MRLEKGGIRRSMGLIGMDNSRTDRHPMRDIKQIVTEWKM